MPSLTCAGPLLRAQRQQSGAAKAGAMTSGEVRTAKCSAMKGLSKRPQQLPAMRRGVFQRQEKMWPTSTGYSGPIKSASCEIHTTLARHTLYIETCSDSFQKSGYESLTSLLVESFALNLLGGDQGGRSRTWALRCAVHSLGHWV